MAKNPVKDPDFQKTLKNLLGMKPKPQSEMKIGKAAKTATQKRRALKTKPRNTPNDRA